MAIFISNILRNIHNIQSKSVVLTKLGQINYSQCCSPVLFSPKISARENIIIYNLNSCNFYLHSCRSYHSLNKRVICNFTSKNELLIIKNDILNNQLFTSHKRTNNNDLNSKSKIRNDDEVKLMQLQFSQPKNVLHNFYNVVAQEVQSDSYKINPQYKMNPLTKKDTQSWTCTYSVKWPEELKFQSAAATKKEASRKAACKVLSYLLKSGKISREGVPLLYEKSTVKQLTRESNFTLILNDFEKEQLGNINRIFKEQILPNMDTEEIERNNYFDSANNNYLGPADYILENFGFEERVSNRNINLYMSKEAVKLPVRDHKEEFEKLLDDNRVIIVRGEPGCGKSTRIPQYALEHFVKSTQTTNARVIVTQPRRIAAISLAERVAQERKERVGNIVGYNVRLDSMFNPRTGRILYCTTGILLRQIQADPSLSHCTHIILDEAHERDVNTDLLMNLVRSAMEQNSKLKLIIMSATIDVNLFRKYFDNPPVMNVPGFTYPVKAHFLEDIKLNLSKSIELWNQPEKANLVYEDVSKLINWIHKNKPEGAILCFLPGWEEIIRIKQLLLNSLGSQEASVVTIHSKLSPEDQRKIFRRPHPGVRKIILATNIAETSVTIDDVVYVIDTGIHKETRFDSERDIMCIDYHRISKSSVNQRKGRAGRVQPGESFHVYPRSAYEDMLEHSVPEILRTSLTKIVLDAKVYSHNMNTEEFFSHLVTPPKEETVKAAVEELQDLEMLGENENLTPLGRVVSDFQLPPKLSKAMIHSVIYKCVVPIVDIATFFSSEASMFAGTLTDKEGIQKIKANLCPDSDHIAMMILFEQWVNMMNNDELREAANYCSKYNLVPQKLNTLKKLKEIYYEYLVKYLKNALTLSDEFSANKEFIKGVLLSGVGTVLQKRNWDFVKGRLKKKNVFVTRNNQRATITSESVNYKRTDFESPFLVYINETRSEMRRTTLIRETSVIQPLTFILFKNSDLIFEEVRDSNQDVENPVLIKLGGTKFKLLCNKEEANLIKNCKFALKSMENYFIYQLTKGGEEDRLITDRWNTVLQMLNSILTAKTV